MRNLCYGSAILLIITYCDHVIADYHVECSTLRIGQYMCPDPDPSYNYIDPKTQQPYGCTKENKAKGTELFGINCYICIFIGTCLKPSEFFSAVQSSRRH
jgi:hypothetical protein